MSNNRAKILAQAKAERESSTKVIDPIKIQDFSDDEIRLEAYQQRDQEGDSISQKISKDKNRNAIFRQMGYDLYCVDDIIPHPNNIYSIDDESIENLAALMLETGNIQPIIIRTLPEGDKFQLLGGERRWRACCLNAKRHGDVWRMIPAKNVGEISDEEALFILHSDNMGQRIKTPSERARGFVAIADRLTKRRELDPEFKNKYKGVKTRKIIADQFGISETSVTNELSIGSKLTEDSLKLLDAGTIGKMQAVEVAKLSPEEQASLVSFINGGDYDSFEIDSIINDVKEGMVGEGTIKKASPQKPRDTNYHMNKACRSLKRACLTSSGKIDGVLLAQVEAYADSLRAELAKQKQRLREGE